MISVGFAAQNKKLHVLITSVPNTHYVPLLPTARELLDRGHEVTLAFKPKAFKSLPMDDLIGARTMVLPYDFSQKDDERQQKLRSKLLALKLPDEITPLVLNLPIVMMSWPSNAVTSQYNSLILQIKELNETDRPNVILAEYFALYGLDVADKLGIPSCVYAILGSNLFSLTRNSPYPKYLLPYSTEKMSFFQTTINVAYQQLAVTDIGIKVWGIARYFTYGLPILWSWNHISENRLVLLGTAPGYSPAEGFPSRFVYAGGGLMPGNVSMGTSRSGVNEKGKDSSVVIDWLEEKQRNHIDVIYAAFGTFYAPSDNDIVQAFKGLVTSNRAVLWSLKDSKRAESLLSKTLPSELHSNVLITNWVQQKQVLAHPAVKIFFSHGGYNSLTECVHFGKPMLCKPMFGDQPYNCQRMKDLGAAIIFERRKLVSSGDLENGVEKILGDYEFYRGNSEKVGEIFRKTGGAKTAVDALELFFTNSRLQGWKRSELSVWQRHVDWIKYLIWSSAILLILLYLWVIFKFWKFVVKRINISRGDLKRD
ncbi:hypothetical protein HK098_005388 [Nowakowskiella sp. JEL0407]|nr:hypothetical protein HK098_005388 [Nowakowskiella sp. JEL0407]